MNIGCVVTKQLTPHSQCHKSNSGRSWATAAASGLHLSTAYVCMYLKGEFLEGLLLSALVLVKVKELQRGPVELDKTWPPTTLRHQLLSDWVAQHHLPSFPFEFRREILQRTGVVLIEKGRRALLFFLFLNKKTQLFKRVTNLRGLFLEKKFVIH